MAKKRALVYDNALVHERLCELAISLLERSSEPVSVHEFTTYFQSASCFPSDAVALRTTSVLYSLEKAGKIRQYPMCGYYTLSGCPAQ